jgi:hypothetical protein
MPVGVFQPSTVDPWGQRVDFDLWRNLVREYSEEFLGMPEYDGSSGTRIDYDLWDFYRRLSRVREEGGLSVVCFGLGVDPLGLGVDVLTAVVVHDEVFDEILGDRVQANEEGHVVATMTSGGSQAAVGVPFTDDSVRHFLEREQMGPGGAACLTLAWQHRDAILTAGLSL